jgi:hypothetical protein
MHFGCGIRWEQRCEILGRVIAQEVASPSIHRDPSGRARSRQPAVPSDHRADSHQLRSEAAVAHEHKPGGFHRTEHPRGEHRRVVWGVPRIDPTVAVPRRRTMRHESHSRGNRDVRVEVGWGALRLERRGPHHAAGDRAERQRTIRQVPATVRQSPRAVAPQRTRNQRPAAIAAPTRFRDHRLLTAGRAPAPWAGPVSRPGPRRVPAGRAMARRRSLVEPARCSRPEWLERRCTWASPPHASSSRACSPSPPLTRPGDLSRSPQRRSPATGRGQRTRRADTTAASSVDPRARRARARGREGLPTGASAALLGLRARRRGPPRPSVQGPVSRREADRAPDDLGEPRAHPARYRPARHQKGSLSRSGSGIDAVAYLRSLGGNTGTVRATKESSTHLDTMADRQASWWGCYRSVVPILHRHQGCSRLRSTTSDRSARRRRRCRQERPLRGVPSTPALQLGHRAAPGGSGAPQTPQYRYSLDPLSVTSRAHGVHHCATVRPYPAGTGRHNR